MWVAFDRIDTDDNLRIDFREFVQAKDLLEQWGINMSNPEQQWASADKDKSGNILFIEFADWAIQRSLDLDDDDNDDDNQ